MNMFEHVKRCSVSGRDKLPLMVALVCWLVCECGCLRRHRDVDTSQGRVRGYLAPHAPSHYVYHGIPYASPPINNHAFKAPRAPPQWDGTFEATYMLKCPQVGPAGSEDCLVLNVFVPEGHNLPVVVIVHGGAFRSGSGETRAPDALIEHGMIVVTLNYRLGALGFLCLDSPSVSGNAGAKDVLFALYWVHKNIESFGGDKYQVTAYGIGSGASIIEMLLLSGMTEGLIHRAILESGTILSPASLVHDPISVAYNAAVSIGFTGSMSTSDLELFYRNADIKQLVNMSENYMFALCVENKYFQNSILETDPREILQSRNFHEVPLVIAYNEDVGFTLKNSQFETLPEHFEDLLPNNLAIDDLEIKHKIAQLTKEFYFEDYTEEEEFIKPLANYLNDVIVEYPEVKSSLLHAIRGTKPVYLMKFMNAGTVDSGESAIFNFFYNSDDVKTDSEILSSLWSNFIKVGDPTPITTSTICTIWMPVYNSEAGFVSVSTAPTLFIGDGMKMGQPTESQKLAFWDNIYKSFYNYNHTMLNT